MPPLGAGASFAIFMDELVALEQQVCSIVADRFDGEKLRDYRWKPDGGLIEPPAIYNWMVLSPSLHMDTSRVRDQLALTARIGVRQSEGHMDRLERYADVFREVVNPETKAAQPLNGSCKWFDKPAFELTFDDFGDFQLVVVAFQINAHLDMFIA